ncbi:MAG: hypothetical protein JXQ83_09765, partial [Candidatus Glassbacteria bacterium]|nr:hypothetical protein [Candidatus Glassbacteria bacterium]
MSESGALLVGMYPGEFSERSQAEHVEDLLGRFGNRVLGDTIHRVGRDLERKLSPGDRVVGPLLEGWKRRLPSPWTAQTLACGLFFRAPGPDGGPFTADLQVTGKVEKKGPAAVLERLCGLDQPLSGIVAEAYRMIRSGRDRQGAVSREKFLETLSFSEREIRNVFQTTGA